MISYKLAKQLKDAGWKPKKAIIEDKGFIDGYQLKIDTRESVMYPTLSELIEAVKTKGKVFMLMINDNFAGELGGWAAALDGTSKSGQTPEEAVAKLWLELNKKNGRQETQKTES